MSCAAAHVQTVGLAKAAMDANAVMRAKLGIARMFKRWGCSI
jgi:hypothetical protein